MKKRLLVFIMVLFGSIGSTYAGEGNIYIFVSFSMPKESIKEWMNAAQEIGAPLIIRGLVHNSFKETIQQVSTLTQDNRGGVQLNPTLFQRFQIDKVPAVVVANNEKCLPTQTCRDEYDVVYGNVTLSYALKKIADRKDALSSTVLLALTKLRETHAS